MKSTYKLTVIVDGPLCCEPDDATHPLKLIRRNGETYWSVPAIDFETRHIRHVRASYCPVCGAPVPLVEEDDEEDGGEV